jgi:hypothetical protein
VGHALEHDPGRQRIAEPDAEIEQLIDEYDRPAPADSVKTRRTAAIKVQYSKASTVAEAIKEVYRDLLSSRDKEFDRGTKGKARTRNGSR